MKRIVSLLCVVCLTMSLLPAVALAAWGGAPVMNIFAEYDETNQQVIATVTLGAHSDLGTLDFRLKFDSTKLVVNGEPVGDATMDPELHADEDFIGFSWYDENGSTKTGETTLLTVTFDIVEGQAGEVEFSFDEEFTCFCDVSGDNLEYEPAAESVTSSELTVPCTNHAVGEEGTEATCTDKATCGTCGASFGAVEPDNHTGTLTEVADAKYLNEPATCSAAATYWKSYSCCGAASDEEYFSDGDPKPHVWSEKIEDEDHLKQPAADCQTYNEYWYDCANCDAISDAEDGSAYFNGKTVGEHKPSSDWTTKDGEHFHACTVDGCTVVFDEDDCTAETDDDNCTTPVLCAVCDTVMTPAKDDHEANADDGDCTTDVTCKYCEHIFTEAKTHVAEDDDGDCTTAVGCANEGCEEIMTPAEKKHVAGEDDGDCSTPIKCENCDQNAVAAKEHDFTGKYDSEDPAQHWHICNNGDCTVTDTKEDHAGGTATCKAKAKCDKCKQTYGTFGPCVDNNGDGQCDVCKEDMCDHVIEPVAAAPATCTTEGNIAHYKCAECGRLYANEDGTGRMDEEDVITKAIAHKNATKQKEVAATCVAPGVKAHFVCPDCGGKYLTKAIDAVAQTDSDLEIAIDPDAHKWDKGDVTVEPTEESEGLKVFTCTNEGCGQTKDQVLSKKNGTSNITPSNPEAEEPAEPEATFSDIAGQWYEEDVEYVAELGLMNGTGSDKFSPDMTTDRAMIVTILWRLEGSPDVDGVEFTDVAEGMWYTAAIDWASANGIVNGYGNGKFGPTDEVTREQIMAILNRYAQYKGWTEDVAVTMVAQYTCSIWAENNVNWADLNGLLADLGVDVSDMTAKASRAELAAYLSRFMLNIAK